jgi:hypothetical protein
LAGRSSPPAMAEADRQKIKTQPDRKTLPVLFEKNRSIRVIRIARRERVKVER